MLVPARTPPEIIGKLHGATVAILQDKAVHAKIVEQGADVIANSPADFRAFIRDESARLAGVIRNSNIVLD
jgi:tripartite-type tricarboxylate transporter receptor subunit TctC